MQSVPLLLYFIYRILCLDSVSRFAWSLTIGFAIAAGKVCRRGKTDLVGNLAHALIGGLDKMLSLPQAQIPHQFDWCEVCQSLYLSVELSPFKPHPRSDFLDIKFGISHFRRKNLQEPIIKITVYIVPDLCRSSRSGLQRTRHGVL